MSKLQKNNSKGSLINVLVVASFFLLMFILSHTMDENTYRRTLVPIIWQLCIFVLLGTSLNLSLGFLGQLTLGHMGFMAIGAYTTALVSLALQRADIFSVKDASPVMVYVGILAIILIGAIFAGLIGLLVGIPALRLRGDYLAIVTLGFGLIVVNIIANLPFAGGEGLAQGTSSSSLYATGLGLSTKMQAQYVWLVLIVTVISVASMFLFIGSKYGRAIKAIRDDDIASGASGVNTTYYKILTFSFSAFFAGLSGGLYATCFSSLSTASFGFASSSIWNSTFIVVLVVLGGMGSLTGSIVSAIIMYLLNYEIKNGSSVDSMPGIVQTLFNYPMLIYAIILMVFIIFRPRGLLGTYEFNPGAIIMRRKKKEAKDNG